MKQLRRFFSKLLLLLLILSQLLGAYHPVQANYIGPANRTTTSERNYTLRVCFYGGKQYCSCVVDGGECGATSNPCGDWRGGCEEYPKTETTTVTLANATSSGSYTCSTPGNNGWCKGGPNIYFSANEPAAGYAIQYIEGNLGLYCDPADAVTVGCNWTPPQGSNTVTYWAHSTYGDTSAMGTIPITVKVDTGAPSASVTVGTPNGANGWFVSPVTATASGSDGTSGIAALNVNIDSGPWQANGTVFSNQGGHTVYGLATDNAGNIAASSPVTFYLDSVAPTISTTIPTPNGSNGWFKSGPINLAVSGTDATSGMSAAQILVSGGSWTNNSASITTNGTYMVNFRTVDVAGNVNSTSTMIKLDSAAPSISLTPTSTPNAQGWYSSAVTVNASISDGSGSGIASQLYRINGGAWINLGSSFQVLPAGVNTIDVSATDNAGNSASQTITIKIDGNAPTLYATLPAPDQGVWIRKASTTEGLTATDAETSVDSIYYLVIPDGVSNSPTIYTKVPGSTASVLVNSSAEVRAYAMDIAGNKSPTRSDHIYLDNQAPVITLTPPQDVSGWYPNPSSLAVAVSDGPMQGGSGIAQVQYRVNSGTWQDLTLTNGQATIPLSIEGTNFVELQAVDVAGNQSAPTNINMKLDGTGPSLSEDIPTVDGTNGWYRTSPVQISLNAADSGSGVNRVYRRDNNGAYVYTMGNIASLNLINGMHSIDWYSVDRVGNLSDVRHLDIKVDAQPPAISAAFSDGTVVNGWHSQIENVTISASDLPSVKPQPPITLEYQLDGSAWQPVNGAVLVNQNGQHTIEIKATDDAGNVTNKTLSFKVDASNPVISADYPFPDGTHDWYITPPTIKATFSDADSGIISYSYTLDDNDPVNSDTVTISTSGQHSLVFTATDSAGHTYDYVNYFVFVDMTKPTLSVHTPTPDFGQNVYYSDPVNIGASASDDESGVTLTYSLDNSDYLPVNGSVNVSGEGKHQLIFRAANWAGQETTQTIPVWIITQAPSVSMILPDGANQEGWYNQPVAMPSASDLPELGLASVEYRLLPAGTYSTTPPQFTENGIYNLEAKLNGLSGLETIGTLVIKIDLDQPKLQLTYPQPDGKNSWYLTSPVNLKAEASDPVSGLSSFCYSLDFSGDVCDSTSLDIRWPGKHTVTFTTVDHASNQNIQTVNINIDGTAPELTLDLPTPQGKNGWYLAPVTVGVRVVEIDSPVTKEYQLDGGQWTAFDQDLSAETGISIETDGNHHLVVRATNEAGLVTTKEADILIDTTAPTAGDILPEGTPTDGSWTDGLDGNGLVLPGKGTYPDGIVLIRYRLLPDGEWTTTPPALNQSGSYQLEVEITDTAGHVINLTLTINLDLTAPEITTNLTGAHNQVKDGVTLTGKIEDQHSGVKSAEISTDGQNWISVTLLANHTFTYTYDTKTAANGQHVDLMVRALDQIGNQSTSTIGLDINNEADKMFIFLPVVLR